MSDLPVELDLKFLPSWLKEEPSPNRYADFEGESPDRARRDDRRGGGGFSGERRGPRPAGGPRPGGPGGPRPGGARPGGGKFEKRGGPGGPKGGPRGDRRDDRGPRLPMPAREPFRPLVRVEILPEPAAASGIAKQIKASSRACGVFNVAKMFMERADRFRLRLHALDENGVIFQVGDGPVGFDRAAVEAGAFRAHRDIFYVAETTQGEPPKGNFTSVARDRFSGVLLGPSSHHSYQTALRRLYEARYARRMEWEGFLRNIEMVNDPAAVEQWKQQASSVTVYKTIVPEGQEPLVFKTEAEAEQHFRATHLPAMVKSGRTLEVSAAAQLLDRGISYIVGDAVEQERRIPLSIVNALRPYFNEAGLHLFKWKRKMLFTSGIRPLRHPVDQTFSDGISAILTTVGENPGIKRPALATRLLTGIAPESPEATAKKEALAADLHYLIQIGYVVEFQNGALELPPTKKEAQQQAQQQPDEKEEITAEGEESEETHEPSKAPATIAAHDADYQILLLSPVPLPG